MAASASAIHGDSSRYLCIIGTTSASGPQFQNAACSAAMCAQEPAVLAERESGHR